jgi:uncharacterized protein (TIGR03086 family)
MDPRDQLAVIIPALNAIVDRIEPADLEGPTPCANFTVQGVLDHMIGLSATFVPAFRGADDAAAAASMSDTADGEVPAAAFHRGMAGLLDAVNSPGAMERIVSAPFGDVPGSVFARFVAFDGLIHGYDLASSTAQAYDLPHDLVASVDSFARDALSPDMRDGDTFALETTPPAGANLLEKLVAFSGRTL